MNDKDKEYFYNMFDKFMKDLRENTNMTEQEIVEKLIDQLIG